MNIQIKRVYEQPSPHDGFRILVDRLWPRGVTKKNAKIDLWIKEIAPSSSLRQWFGHDPNKWNEFKRRYYEELNENKVLVTEFVKLVKKEKTTLVYGAKDQKHNNAVVLKDYLES